MKKITFLTGLIWVFMLINAVHAQHAWPAESWTSSVNLTSLDAGFSINMSGQFWNPLKRDLYVVSNSGIFWRLKEGGPLGFMIDTTGGLAKWSPGGDLEDITQANYSDNSVFVMNEAGYIQEYSVAVNGTTSVLHSWDIRAQAAPNLGDGPEGIAFVPDEWLSYNGFVDQNNNPYTSVNGMGGLIFVAHQTGGYIYVFDLNRSNNTYIFVGKYATAYTESSGLAFDRSVGKLFIWHNTGSNYIEVTEMKSYDLGSGIRKFYPQTSFYGPRSGNLEGIAFTPSSAAEHWYFATDDGNQNGYAVYWFKSFHSCVFEPFFTADKTTACAGENLIISDTSTGLCGSEGLLWNFGSGANPATATGPGPFSISYQTPGLKNIRLNVTGLYADSLIKNSYIEIFSLPDVAAHATLDTVCSGSAVSLSGEGASIYTWSDSIENSIEFIPPQTHTYTVTGTDTNHCSNTDSITIVVNALPQVILAGFEPDTLCITTGAFILTGGLPANGTYTGNGVLNGMFDPLLAGSGTSMVNYEFTDNNDCSNSASQAIYVDVCSGISSKDEEENFTIFPNPNNGIFSILSEKALKGTIVNIYNFNGEQIYSTPFQEQGIKTLDISKYRKGIYLLTINDGERILSEMIMIN